MCHASLLRQLILGRCNLTVGYSTTKIVKEPTGQLLGHPHFLLIYGNYLAPYMDMGSYRSKMCQCKVEGELRWMYEKYGTGLTVFFPLKQGILTGKSMSDC